MSDLDTWAWGVVSSGASARGRQCYLLQLDTAPVRTGRFRVAWLDEDGEVLAWWVRPIGAPLTDGWSDERSLVLATEDEADHELYMARRSYGGRRERRIEIVEVV